MSIEKHNSNNVEKPKNSVLEFLAEKNKTLANDYHTPDGNYSESCTLIAVDVARMLLKEGKKPELVSITGKRVDSPYVLANEPLEPLRYEGRVVWGGHTVCVCEGLVYDPMVGVEPTPIEEYAHKAFGVNIEMKTMVSSNEIEEFVNR